MLSLLVALSTSLAPLVTATSPVTYPRYTVHDHPLLQHATSARPTPVALSRYYRIHADGRRDLSGLLYAPRAAAYRTACGPLFGSDLDALLLPRAALSVHLNHPVRVIVLASGGVSRDALALTGLPGFGNATHISLLGMPSPIGEVARGGVHLRRLPKRALAVERVLQPGELSFALPHPSAVRADGTPVRRLTVLLAAVGSGLPARAPGYPRAPPGRQQPEPNRECPPWLHDLHVAPSGDAETSVVHGEPMTWQTWHPMVDPVFWCYYAHEHGAFPGWYRPRFGYTAWKTPDNSTTHGRQNESHNGFKMFSFPVPGENRVLSGTVHMHLAKARRFTARHHTVVFAVHRVLPDGAWDLEMELSMKMDFGPAQVTLATRKTIPATEVDEDVKSELDARGVRAGRRFNVLNIDEGFPDTVNTTLIVKGDLEKGPKAVSRGVYEQWKGPLNSCMKSGTRVNRGFKFDIRDPATAMRFTSGTTDDNIQYLRGKSIKKVFHIRNGGVEIGLEYCNLKNWESVDLEASQGVFYTNPYFSEVVDGPGANAVRQFIKPGFETVRIAKGKFTAVDPWHGHMELQEGKGTRKFVSIENAIDPKVN